MSEDLSEHQWALVRCEKISTKFNGQNDLYIDCANPDLQNSDLLGDIPGQCKRFKTGGYG